MKHVHHDMIVEWAKDTSRVVETLDYGHWVATSVPRWHTGSKYRFKTEPKPDVVRYANIQSDFCFRDIQIGGDNLKFTFDGETGALKSVEVLK